MLAAFLLVLAFVKLSSVAAFTELASDLPQVSDWDGFIALTVPGLDKYGATIALVLTAVTALSIGASRHNGASSHLGVTTFLLAVPCFALALAGLSQTVWVALTFAILGLLITASRKDYVPARIANLIVWALAVGGLYWLAVAFARA
ncbi:hypothetical protein [Kineococcus arenarius]|uniref:hypothetical protein n=1 Tax=unclassified Kineococcus TaxID=2621656 RepID=UPI003D7D7651